MKPEQNAVKKKYIAIKRCQARGDDGKIRFYSAGKIAYFSAVPAKHCFILASDASASSVDFNTVAESILLDESIVPVRDIASYIFTRFGEDYSGFTRQDIVAALVNLRNAPPELLSASDSTVPTSAEYTNTAKNVSESGISVEMTGEQTKGSSEDMKIVTEGIEEVDDLDDLLGEEG